MKSNVHRLYSKSRGVDFAIITTLQEEWEAVRKRDIVKLRVQGEIFSGDRLHPVYKFNAGVGKKAGGGSLLKNILEHGTDLRYIQEILCLSSSQTAKIYTHVSAKDIANIRSLLLDIS